MHIAWHECQNQRGKLDVPDHPKDGRLIFIPHCWTSRRKRERGLLLYPQRRAFICRSLALLLDLFLCLFFCFGSCVIICLRGVYGGICFVGFPGGFWAKR